MAKNFKKRAKGSKKAAAKSEARAGFHGRTTGLSVGKFAAQLFAANFKAKLDDTQLMKALVSEFPSRKDDMYPVQSLRTKWNGGKLITDDKPDRPLPRYEDGKPVEGRAGGGGKSTKAHGGKKRSAKGGGKKIFKKGKARVLVSDEGKS